MSKRWDLNNKDWNKIIINGLIFLAPALLVLIGSIREVVPNESTYAVIILFILNIATDLLRKLLAGKK